MLACEETQRISHGLNLRLQDVPLAELMYLVFSRMPGESYWRWLKSLLLCLCDVFWALINSLVLWLFKACLETDNVKLRPKKKLTESIALWSEMLPTAAIWYGDSLYLCTMVLYLVVLNLQSNIFCITPTLSGSTQVPSDLKRAETLLG